jgi:Tol biopolymer transport system component
MRLKLKRLAVLVAVLTFARFGAAQSGATFDSRIAFVQGSDIFIMNPDGSHVRRLTNLGANNSAFYESWSPDGRQLVFSEYPNNGPGQLWVMNSADGSGQHVLLSEVNFDDEAPSFSPDGVWVIFRRCPADFTDCAIYKIRTDGSGLTQVTDFQPAILDWEAYYSPDGMSIIVQSLKREGLISDFWLMNADSFDLHPLIPPELLATDPQWSPDGEKIAFGHCCSAQTSDIWVINRDGHDLHRLTGSHTTDIAVPAPYSNGAPSWSPHGRAIVFNQYTPSSNTNAILVINADGSARRQVMSVPAALTRASSRATAEASHANKRRHFARQIESGGVWPRWSPEFQ